MVHGFKIVRMGADHCRTAVVDNVFEIVRAEPIINWHWDRTDLWYRVVAFQMSVRVRGDVVDYTITSMDSEGSERRGPAVATLEELPIVQRQRPIDNRLTTGVEPPRAPCKLYGS